MNFAEKNLIVCGYTSTKTNNAMLFVVDFDLNSSAIFKTEYITESPCPSLDAIDFPVKLWSFYFPNRFGVLLYEYIMINCEFIMSLSFCI